MRKLRSKEVKKLRHAIYLVSSDQDSNLDYVVSEPGLLATTMEQVNYCTEVISLFL